MITLDAPPLSGWDAAGAVKLWWNDKTRRLPTSSTRNRAGPSTSKEVESDGAETTDTFRLDDWEEWLS